MRIPRVLFGYTPYSGGEVVPEDWPGMFALNTQKHAELFIRDSFPEIEIDIVNLGNIVSNSDELIDDGWQRLTESAYGAIPDKRLYDLLISGQTPFAEAFIRNYRKICFSVVGRARFSKFYGGTQAPFIGQTHSPSTVYDYDLSKDFSLLFSFLRNPLVVSALAEQSQSSLRAAVLGFNKTAKVKILTLDT
jgi:hypothetical protein